MNEQLQKALVEWLTDLKTVAWEQTPEVIRQYIGYSRIVNTVEFALALAAALLAPIFLLRLARKMTIKRDWGSDLDGTPIQIVAFILLCVITLVSFITVCTTFEPCIASWVSPKAYALKWMLKL